MSEDLRWIAASKIWVPAGLTSEAGNKKIRKAAAFKLRRNQRSMQSMV